MSTSDLERKPAARLKPNQAAKFRRDSIGFIFQSFNFLPRLTTLENVALPLVYKGMAVNRRIKQASQMLERVGVNTHLIGPAEHA